MIPFIEAAEAELEEGEDIMLADCRKLFCVKRGEVRIHEPVLDHLST